MNFIDFTVNVVSPSQYFSEENVENLLEQYGELAFDGPKEQKTLYLRQDTEDPNSRRACSLKNESPIILEDNRLLILNIYPTTKVYNAVINKELEGIEIVSNDKLSNYIK